MENIKIENVVIGAGPGGYVAAIKLAQLGKEVLVIEKEKLGGVCLNVGCIPSKALINAAHVVDTIHIAQEMGFSVSTGEKLIDMDRLQVWKNKIVKKLVDGIGTLFKLNKVKHIMGNAVFKDKNHIEVTNSEGTITVEFNNIIIATGSSAIEIPGFKFDEQKILSSTGALDLNQVPKNLVVVGGGYIGLEIGTYLLKLGAKINIVEATANLLPASDPELVAVVVRKLKKNGANIMLETKAKSAKIDGDNVEVTVVTKTGEEQIINADYVMVTVGRRPNSKDLGLENLGIEIDHGFIKVNKKMQTNIPNIYAIGDVVGGYMLAHKASKEGIVVAEVIAGHKTELDFYAMPSVVFTDPEIASVGITEKEAAAKGIKAKVGKFPFAALGKALASGESDGFVKVVINEETQELLGLHIVGHEASSLISEGALAIEMGATAEDIALTIHPHPTLPEGIMEAAEAAMGKAIHIIN
ncbi:MAG: dihydrolipoyl dehydrogenase [Candidatus Sericytochromatia bacterium]|nr:dihydrolipoyl dehydrogenase [Candidatus Sericytochromatia bacterium]